LASSKATGVYSCGEGGAGLPVRDQVSLGVTSLSRAQVLKLLVHLKARYLAKDYHVLKKNCIHFCRDFVFGLGVDDIPAWVHRTVTWGKWLQYVIPSRLLTFRPALGSNGDSTFMTTTTEPKVNASWWMSGYDMRSVRSDARSMAQFSETRFSQVLDDELELDETDEISSNHESEMVPVQGGNKKPRFTRKTTSSLATSPNGY
jgi:hypothetical protein